MVKNKNLAKREPMLYNFIQYVTNSVYNKHELKKNVKNKVHAIGETTIELEEGPKQYFH